MKIASQEGLLPGKSFEEKVQSALKLGLEGVELSGRGIESRIDKIRDVLSSYDIKISSICSGYRGDLLGIERKERTLAMEDIKTRLRISAEIGAVGVIVVPTFGRPKLPDLYPLYSDVWSLEKEMLVEELKELGKFANDVGSYVLLEPLNRYETHFLNRLEQAIQIVEEVGLEHVRLMADFFHMNIEEADIPQSLLKVGKYLKHIHLADSNRVLPGFGHTNFDEPFKVLKEINYKDYMVFECRVPEPRMENLRRSISYLKEIIDRT